MQEQEIKDAFGVDIDLEDVVPSAFYSSITDPIMLEFDMKNKQHRKLMKFIHSQWMHAYRRERTKKRVKEQSRRAMLKWNALHPHEKHSLK